MSAFSNLQKHDSAREMLLAHTCSLHRGQSRREIYIILICSEEKKLKMAMNSRDVLSSAVGTNPFKKDLVTTICFLSGLLGLFKTFPCRAIYSQVHENSTHVLSLACQAS